MQIQCPGCGSRYRINAQASGRSAGRVRCPKCSRVFEVDLNTPPAGPAQRTVLVVDDARFFREVIVDVLAPLDCRLLTAADAEAALETIRREQPQLVILDLNLPGMNGYELVKAIRAEVGRGIKLLAMSGVFRKDEDILGIQAAGADDFTSKSFKPEDFLARVRRLLGV